MVRIGNCIVCGVGLEARRGPKPKYCPKCKNPQQATKWVACGVCGDAVEIKRPGRPRKYCFGCHAEAKRVGEREKYAAIKDDYKQSDSYLDSLKNSQASRAAERAERVMVCKWCGATFNGHKRRCCSDVCQEQAKRARDLAWRKGPTGVAYRQRPDVRAKDAARERVYGRRPEVRVRRAAYEVRYRGTPRGRAVRQAGRRRHDALVRLNGGVMGDCFTYEEIFERDGWICQICGKAVWRNAKWPHPKSVSLDHIVPVSKGGSHTRENVQWSHVGCNSSKCDKVGGYQLRLCV